MSEYTAIAICIVGAAFLLAYVGMNIKTSAYLKPLRFFFTFLSLVFAYGAMAYALEVGFHITDQALPHLEEIYSSIIPLYGGITYLLYVFGAFSMVKFTVDVLESFVGSGNSSKNGKIKKNK